MTPTPAAMEKAKQILADLKIEINPYAMKGTDTLGGLISPHSFWKLAEAIDQARASERKEIWDDIRAFKPYLHFCQDWDGLIIDSNDPEFKACNCFDPKPKRNLKPAQMPFPSEQEIRDYFQWSKDVKCTTPAQAFEVIEWLKSRMEGK